MLQHLKKIIEEAIHQHFPTLERTEIRLDRPDNEQFGDFSTNIALAIAKQLGQPPLTVAQTIADGINSPEIDHVTVAAPGFINIFLKPEAYRDLLTDILAAGDQFGRSALQQQDILFEFGQPNTHKVPHIGHLFSYCYGESCVRLLAATGNKVHRVNYQGDVGPHVAKCLWAYQKNTQADPESLAEKVQYLQERYQAGSRAYEEDPVAKTAIDSLNRAIYLQDAAVLADWQKTRQWSIDYYKDFETRIGVDYDKYYFESEISQRGVEIVRHEIGKVFEEDNGAVIFRGEPFGLHTRVFINQAGNPTYEAKDIGLAAQKWDDWHFDSAIVTTAVEQSEYWRVVKKAIELIFPEFGSRIQHIGFGLINLTTGKMSSRTGQFVSAFDLVEQVKMRVKEYIAANRDYPAEETEKISELVAIGAIKYAFLRSTAGKNINFDLESSISFDGNSGPYLQYTYARCQSVLGKAGEVTNEVSEHVPNAEEIAIIRALSQMPDVVNAAADDCAPHVLCTLLFELAQRYSYFYNQHQILVDDLTTAKFRLALTKAVATTLKTGLNLLGIEVSNKI